MNPGWRRSADRTSLQANSLVSGNFKGNFAILGLRDTIEHQETAALQPLLEQFPTQISREKISINREFFGGNREFSSVNYCGWIGRELPRGKLISTLSSPAILFSNHAAPCRQALGGMLLHPLGELRRAHQAGLHRDVSEVRGGDGLLVAICRRGETAEHGDDLYHDRRTPSLRWALAPLTL